MYGEVHTHKKKCEYLYAREVNIFSVEVRRKYLCLTIKYEIINLHFHKLFLPFFFLDFKLTETMILFVETVSFEIDTLSVINTQMPFFLTTTLR